MTEANRLAAYSATFALAIVDPDNHRDHAISNEAS